MKGIRHHVLYRSVYGRMLSRAGRQSNRESAAAIKLTQNLRRPRGRRHIHAPRLVGHRRRRQPRRPVTQVAPTPKLSPAAAPACPVASAGSHVPWLPHHIATVRRSCIINSALSSASIREQKSPNKNRMMNAKFTEVTR